MYVQAATVVGSCNEIVRSAQENQHGVLRLLRNFARASTYCQQLNCFGICDIVSSFSRFRYGGLIFMCTFFFVLFFRCLAQW